MPTGTPQTTFSLDNPGVVAGQRFDATDEDFITSKPCGAAALLPGYAVELVNGLLQIAQGTSDPNSKSVWGVVMYKSGEMPSATGYLPGQQVPVLRRGRIAVVLDSGFSLYTDGAAANLCHSSNASHGQGTFTNAATSGTVGQEISDVGAKFYLDVGQTGNSPGLAVVEINLPQKGV